MCHGHPGHARSRAGCPCHVAAPTSRPALRRCAMPILAMPGHGRDARVTLRCRPQGRRCGDVPWPSWPCPVTGGMPVPRCGADLKAGAAAMCHGHPGHARSRAGRPCHVCVPTSRSALRRCAMAILAMPDHGRDARVTLRCRPQGRRYTGAPLIPTTSRRASTACG